jgi:hypothetical protein
MYEKLFSKINIVYLSVIKNQQEMKVTIRVSSQYYENYNVDSQGFNNYGDKKPHWKPKGEQVFEFPVDSENIMYISNELLVEAISKFVQSQNTESAKYEYIEHTIQFHNPYVIDGFDSLLEELWDTKMSVK